MESLINLFKNLDTNDHLLFRKLKIDLDIISNQIIHSIVSENTIPDILSVLSHCSNELSMNRLEITNDLRYVIQTDGYEYFKLCLLPYVFEEPIIHQLFIDLIQFYDS